MTPEQERRESFEFFRGLLWGVSLSVPTYLCVLVLVLVLIP